MRIPHRKLDGELVFLAGEIRQWLGQTEVVAVGAQLGPVVVARQRRSG